MRFPFPPRLVLPAVALLVVTNTLTGLLASHVAYSRDFSDDNMNCLLNWGSIGGQFDAARVRTLPGIHQQSEADVFHMHEDNARFVVHYPKFCRRTGSDQDRPLTLFCWAVAADCYRQRDVDIEVDPAVWRAFLADGPKSLPVYWNLRESLTRAGAGQGLIHGEDDKHLFSNHKPPPHKLGRLSTPYQPLPDEAAPT